MIGEIIGAAGSIAGGLLGGSKKAKVPKRVKYAQNALLGLARGPAPNMPLLGVAGEDALEEELYNLTRGRLSQLGGPSPYDESKRAVRSLMDIGDPTQSDVYQGILSRAAEAGTRSNRNVGRALRLSGNAPTASGKGRDILGRNTDDWTQGMAVSLADYVAKRRASEFNIYRGEHRLSESPDILSDCIRVVAAWWPHFAPWIDAADAAYMFRDLRGAALLMGLEGRSLTFSHGGINAWRKRFNPYHTELAQALLPDVAASYLGRSEAWQCAAS